MRGPAPTWLNGGMSFLRDEMTAHSRARVGRIAGAGLGGAVIGMLVGWIWGAGAAAASAAVSACESTQGADSVCIAIVPDAAAIAGNIVVISAGTLITLWTVRVGVVLLGSFTVPRTIAPSDLALALTVDITRAGTSDGAFDLGMCKPGEKPPAHAPVLLPGQRAGPVAGHSVRRIPR